MLSLFMEQQLENDRMSCDRTGNTAGIREKNKNTSHCAVKIFGVVEVVAQKV